MVLSLIPSICPSPLLPFLLLRSLSSRWLGVRNATQWWPGTGPRGDRRSQQQSREKRGRGKEAGEEEGRKEQSGWTRTFTVEVISLGRTSQRRVAVVHLLTYFSLCMLLVFVKENLPHFAPVFTIQYNHSLHHLSICPTASSL